MSTQHKQTNLGIEVTSYDLVDFCDMAHAFAAANDNGQRQFLEHLAIILDGVKWDGGKWPMQCRYIADNTHWMPTLKQRCIDQLEVLIEHLKDSQK